MRLTYVLTFILTPMFILGACNGEKDSLDNAEVFPTKEEALHYFFGEDKPKVELIKTVHDELFIVRNSGNNQYSVYGITIGDSKYTVQKLTATLSLHNTIGGGVELSSIKGNDYTLVIAKQPEHFDNSIIREYEFFSLSSINANVSLSKGHILNDSSASPINAIQTIETIINK